MIDRVRALLTVIEEGSVNRAAVRLRITQPALSRQMKLLESEVGGKLLERETSGVKPTGLGHTLVKVMRPVIDSYEAALAEVRRQARGSGSELRVGFLISAAQSILTPAMERLRKDHPEIRLKLHDMSPKEQIDALKSGGLDLALIGQEGAVAARDFHSLKLCSLGVCVALSNGDPLACRKKISIRELAGRDFIGVDEDQMPGRNRWITSLCRTAGFKPRFIATTDGITHVLSMVASESAVTLLPDYFKTTSHPGITFVPVSDARARWDFIVLWQRGKTTACTTALVEALKEAALKISGSPLPP
ncbi:LysR family transcriptional regulator [Luteolibacter yonseiensis]|uniref:LysR family transcriptional regulator n=1 Tax=Luteolibacter yonseiensis TaxID=1144680 RepID=A0A934RAG5_9BACT|nr:LysR family transcriptional regulator [Luteolibacter yonseiensis]MBK1817984.1 LysR family transcriptional regulator [Luteolibacter yonseiensis]